MPVEDDVTTDDDVISQKPDEVKPADDAEKPEGEETNPEGEAGEVAEEEDVYTFADTPPQEKEEPDNHVIRDLRKAHREAQRRIKELEAKQVIAEPPKPVLPPRPTLESCDYDPEEYEQKLDSWFQAKKEVEAAEAEERKKHEEAQKDWQAKRKAYDQAKKRFPLDDFEDAEDVVRNTLSETQQGVLVHVAERPERLVYALGKSPAKAKELAAIKDPLKLAAAITKLEGSIVAQKKSAPPPERTVRAGGGSGAESDRNYEAALKRIMEQGGSIDELRRLRKQNAK